MAIEIPTETRQILVASIQRYFKKNMEEQIGNITAGALLGFFMEEIGPLVYNKVKVGSANSWSRTSTV